MKKFMFSKLYILYTLYIYIYKIFSTMLDKGLRKNIKKKRRDGKIRKHKLNEIGALSMK